MEVRQEHGLDTAKAEAHPADAARGAAAGVGDEQPPASEHQRAWAGTLFVGKGRARAAQAHMQAVAQFGSRSAAMRTAAPRSASATLSRARQVRAATASSAAIAAAPSTT